MISVDVGPRFSMGAGRPFEFALAKMLAGPSGQRERERKQRKMKTPRYPMLKVRSKDGGEDERKPSNV